MDEPQEIPSQNYSQHEVYILEVWDDFFECWIPDRRVYYPSASLDPKYRIRRYIPKEEK